MSQETISSIENPELANQLVQAALAMSPEEEVQSLEVNTTPTPKIVLPPSDEVTLLAGLYNPFTGELVETAEIRELNGNDEEAISKITDYGRSLLSILQRGTVKIGDKPCTQDLLDSLLAGDREYLIIKIRIATFGAEIELEGKCTHCDELQKFIINLESDVSITPLEEKHIRSFTVDCKVGEVRVDLPNGAVQRKLISSTDKTSAELDSILLKECITDINGLPIMDPNQVKKLGMQDRRTLLKAITDKNPGPDLSTIAKNCSSCGLEVPIPLTLADLFRL